VVHIQKPMKLSEGSLDFLLGIALNVTYLKYTGFTSKIRNILRDTEKKGGFKVS